MRHGIGKCRRVYTSPTLGTSHAALAVGKTLYHLFALALDLPETYFEDKVWMVLLTCLSTNLVASDRFQTKESVHDMRTVRYPPQTDPVDDRMVGLGAHTEYFILLYTRIYD